MHRVLAALIAVLLAGGAAAVVVKSDDDDTVPIVQPTTSPTPTETFDDGTPTETPTEPGTEEPTVEPGTEEPTVEPTDTMTELPRTGGGSFAPAALLTLAIALGAGLAVSRASRSRA